MHGLTLKYIQVSLMEDGDEPGWECESGGSSGMTETQKREGEGGKGSDTVMREAVGGAASIGMWKCDREVAGRWWEWPRPLGQARRQQGQGGKGSKEQGRWQG